MPEIGLEVGKDRILGGLLKTGQTTRYGGYDDDGYYGKGLSKRYTVLDKAQYDGTTSITIYNKTDLISNACVFDLRTKLMWLRTPPDALGPASDGKLPWTTNVNGEGIFPFVTAANLAKLAGYSDWRIPNIFEGVSLSLWEAPAISADPVAFPSGLAVPMWTSTTRPNSTSNAISFTLGGNFMGLAIKTSTCICILVR